MMFKRLFDLFFASIVLVLALPILGLIATAIFVALGPPIFFVQTRAGLHGRSFDMIKFRTMLLMFDANGRPLPDAARMTRIGRFLRSTSLDELPELWNVVRGEMSLVGPRPLLTEYLPLYSQEQARRHAARPGITGWAQVRGRNALSWEEKFRLDVWYVDNRSFWLDLKILLLTCQKVLTREGINAPNEETTKRFIGAKGEAE